MDKILEKVLESHIQTIFVDLNRHGAEHSIPAGGTLSILLSKYAAKEPLSQPIPATREVLKYFATASVEIWQRSVHSFLISASLTDVSPIWSSVAGYYSSHYAVRALAHLLGAFHLHRMRRIVYIERSGTHDVMRIEKKDAPDREHKFYWKFVSQHRQFVLDPFFYAFQEDSFKPSDGGHRNWANYMDHIARFPTFSPLSIEFLQKRVRRISEVPLSSVPVPSAEKFPDILNVQFVAYHRLVKFRRLLDEVLGTKNRFWNVQRKPQWCQGVIGFSVIEPVFAALYAGR